MFENVKKIIQYINMKIVELKHDLHICLKLLIVIKLAEDTLARACERSKQTQVEVDSGLLN